MLQPLTKIYHLLAIALVMSLPFSLGEIQLNSYLIILFAVCTFALFFVKKEFKNRLTGTFVLFISVYLMHILGLFGSDNSSVASFELQKKLSLLLFPLLLYISPKFTYQEVKRVMLAFVLSCTVTMIFCFCTAIFRFVHLGDTSFFFYHSLSSIAGMHATYLSMYLCFAIAILVRIYSEGKNNFRARGGLILFSAFVILVAGVLLLGSRTQLLILILGSFLYGLLYFYKRFGLLKAILASVSTAITIMGLMLLIPANRERLKEAINYKNQYGLDRRWGEEQVRYLIWSSAFDLVKAHPLTGVGTGDVQDELHKYYIEKEYISLTYLPNTRYNAHNQFLETAIGLGVFGFLVLLAAFLFPLYHAWKYKSWLYFTFILIFLCSCMTESLLERQSGIVFYAFFNSFLYLYRFSKEDASESFGLPL